MLTRTCSFLLDVDFDVAHCMWVLCVAFIAVYVVIGPVSSAAHCSCVVPLVPLQLPPVDVAMDGIDGEDGSPVLTQRRVPPGGSPPDAPRRDLSHSQIEPEYEEAHCTQLSPLGREQVCGCGWVWLGECA